MHPELHAILSETPPAKRTGHVTPEMATHYLAGRPYAVSLTIQKHFETAGISTTSERSGAGIRRHVVAGFHSLRHSAVSLMREAGAAQSISQAIVGHNSPEVHALYTHADEDALRRAVSALPSVLGNMKALPAPALSPPDMPAVALAESGPLAAFKSKLRALAQGMTPKTWRKAQTELLALAG
jgi:hypothetical protein